MSGTSDPEIKGTLIRGADGSIYFVPDENLEAFRVPEEHARPVRESLEKAGAAAGDTQGYMDVRSGIIVVGGVTARRPQALGPTIVPSIVYRR